jgi:hypothetical protein
LPGKPLRIFWAVITTNCRRKPCSPSTRGSDPLRRGEYPFFGTLGQEAFRMAAGIPAPTLSGQAAFAPAKPGVFVALVHKTRLPSCRRQGSVPQGDSTFPASSPTKGITHYTLHAKLCANRDAARPYWMTQLKAPILQTI